MTKSEKNTVMITLTVVTGALMSTIDSSIVNVALPYMKGNMGASVEEIAWVSTSYILANVIVMPTVGLLSSRYRRRNVYLASILLFTFSSLLCGIAWDLNSMIFFRVLQGIGGGPIIPISQAILRESYSKEKQGLAMMFVTLSTLTLSCIENEKITAASRLYNVLRFIFGSVGIALAATFLNRYDTSYYSYLTEKVTSVSDTLNTWQTSLTSLFFSNSYNPASAGMMGLKAIDGLVRQQSSMMAYNHVFLLVTFLYLLSVPTVFLLKTKK